MVLEKLRNIPCIIALFANKIKHYNIFQIDKAFTIFCLRKISIIFSFHYWVWHITGAFSENVNKQRDTEFPKNKIKLWNFKIPPRKIPKSRKKTFWKFWRNFCNPWKVEKASKIKWRLRRWCWSRSRRRSWSRWCYCCGGVSIKLF